MNNLEAFKSAIRGEIEGLQELCDCDQPNLDGLISQILHCNGKIVFSGL